MNKQGNMKVLWFTNTPASGEEYLKGVGVRGGWLKSLDKALKNKVELSVAFYYARYADDFRYNDVDYYPISKKKWKFEILRKRFLGEYIDDEDLQIYLELIDRVKPDIIHIHGTENSFGCIVGETTIPIVLSIQGNRTVNHHKYLDGIESNYLSFSKRNYLSLDSLLFSTNYKRDYANSGLTSQRERKYIGGHRYIIGRTDWDRRLTRLLAPASHYFHNDEVLRGLFYQSEWQLRTTTKVIVQSTIGLGFSKGFETVCQAVTELVSYGLDIEWRIAGIHENDLIVKIVKKKLKERYPSKGLRLMGNMHEEALVASLLEASVYVMPSHIENSPNNLCEAMILGMPCVACFAGGTSSLITDGSEGVLIQTGDPWSMAGSVLELLANPDKAVQMGQNARKRALARHNPEVIVSGLLEIYQLIERENVSIYQKEV